MQSLNYIFHAIWCIKDLALLDTKGKKPKGTSSRQKNLGLWSQKHTYPQWGEKIDIGPHCISTCKVLFLLSTKYINMNTQEGLQQGKKQELY